MNLKLTGNVARVIAEYTGREPVKVMGYPDPKVEGTFAYRAEFADEPKVLDFLTVGVSPNKLTTEELEDAGFDEWPPRSGKVKFFW